VRSLGLPSKPGTEWHGRNDGTRGRGMGMGRLWRKQRQGRRPHPSRLSGHPAGWFSIALSAPADI
jgi:hypothetical protein